MYQSYKTKTQPMAYKVLTLNDGNQMPNLGLGTWLANPGEIKLAVKEALKIGYRHIDCAYLYKNNDEIGEALQESIQEGVVKREDVFITSKIWNSFHREECFKDHLTNILKDLKVTYLDLLLLHWPMAFKPGHDWLQEGEKFSDIIDQVDQREVWSRLEDAKLQGLTKSIGICNFNEKQLDYIVGNCRIRPAVHQFENHAYLTNMSLVKHSRDLGMIVTAFSPLANPAFSQTNLLGEPLVKEIAKKHKRTEGQVLINFALARGLICIPKSVKPARLKENFEAKDFLLTNEDIESLNALNKNLRTLNIEVFKEHPDYPYN